MDKDYFDEVARFAIEKEQMLNDGLIASPPMLDRMIAWADKLNLPASKAQLIRYRDHYYGGKNETESVYVVR